MSAKDTILKQLRSGQTPFSDVSPVSERHVIVPMDDVDLVAHFIQQAKALSAHVYQAENEASAIETILSIIAEDKEILAWDFEHIPVSSLKESLNYRQITVADSRNGSVRVGITGAEAALSATGSLVISAKEGKPRSVSLLPYIHISIIRKNQIIPHFDAWIEQQSHNKHNFRDSGNHIVITGASRTADIGMELVLGAHGSAELHIIILD